MFYFVYLENHCMFSKEEKLHQSIRLKTSIQGQINGTYTDSQCQHELSLQYEIEEQEAVHYMY